MGLFIADEALDQQRDILAALKPPAVEHDRPFKAVAQPKAGRVAGQRLVEAEADTTAIGVGYRQFVRGQRALGLGVEEDRLSLLKHLAEDAKVGGWLIVKAGHHNRLIGGGLGP